MRRWRRLGAAFLCAATLGCGPVVPGDADTEGDGAGTTALPSAGSTLPELTSSGASTSASTPNDGLKLDVWHPPTTGPFDDPCNDGWNVQPLHPAVVFVIDTSQSMVTHLVDHDLDPDTPDVTRWLAVRVALEDALPQWDGSHDLGVRAFPAPDAATRPDPGACSPGGPGLAPVPIGSDAVLDALPPATSVSLGGATPTRAALEDALALLATGDGGKQGFVVLVTDGAPNCAPGSSGPAMFDDVDGLVEPLIAGAAATGTRTVVLGFDVANEVGGGGADADPITNPAAVLDVLAIAGGVWPQAPLPVDSLSLSDLLQQARVAAASHRLRIPDPSYGWYEVHVGGAIYHEVADCSEDGFVLLASGGGGADTIELCGDARDALQQWGWATIYPVCVIPE